MIAVYGRLAYGVAASVLELFYDFDHIEVEDFTNWSKANATAQEGDFL
ncbi:hypothetical protein [uncultured Tateyamaria sp.]|nr:hypothetical protein [uncultured Tateyamaria sp.]